MEEKMELERINDPTTNGMGLEKRVVSKNNPEEVGDNEKVRLSVYLPQDLVKVLRGIGKDAGLKDAEVIRYLIALGQTVHEEVARGNQLATTKDGKTVEARLIGVK